MVYVLEGSIVMQVKGQAPVTLTPGQTWYEGPDDVHVVSQNASNSAPAKYLVFMVKDKGAPILTPVKSGDNDVQQSGPGKAGQPLYLR